MAIKHIYSIQRRIRHHPSMKGKAPIQFLYLKSYIEILGLIFKGLQYCEETTPHTAGFRLYNV